MKTFIAVAAVAVAVTGCASIDNYLGSKQEEFARICRTEPLVYAAYVSLVPNPSRSVHEAHEVVTEVCKNPPADSSQALIAVSNAFAKVLAARSQAEKVAG